MRDDFQLIQVITLCVFLGDLYTNNVKFRSDNKCNNQVIIIHENAAAEPNDVMQAFDDIDVIVQLIVHWLLAFGSRILALPQTTEMLCMQRGKARYRCSPD